MSFLALVTAIAVGDAAILIRDLESFQAG